MYEVVRCAEKDINAVGAFYDIAVKYLTEHVNYPKWRYKEYPSLHTVQSACQSGTQYMCIENGKVVGAFVLNCDPQGAYDRAVWGKDLCDGEYMVIHSFATHPSLSRKGIGEKMLNFCIKQAKKQNMQAIRLDVVPTNLPAKAFYEKYGFRFVGEIDLNRNFEDIPTFCLYELNL